MLSVRESTFFRIGSRYRKLNSRLHRDFDAPSRLAMCNIRQPTTVDRARTFHSIFAEYRRRCISYRIRACVYGIVSKDRGPI